MTEPKYDIVIPSWNMSEYAIKCLESIKKYSDDYRVIFVDNGSDISEFQAVSRVLFTMPHKLIANRTNLGFIKATNLGILVSTAPYIVLMNNDTEAVEGWLDKLVQPLSDNPTVMLSGPLTTTQSSWQGVYPKGLSGYIIRISGMLAFFCTMFKREVFDTVGMLDENFGVGFGDDDDYCRRVINSGYHMSLVQDLVIPHNHRTTFTAIYGMDEVKELQKAAMHRYKTKHNLK